MMILVLAAHSLDRRVHSYFGSPKESSHITKAKGHIDMSDAIMIEGNQQMPGVPREKNPWVFTIETKGGRTYYLSAADQAVGVSVVVGGRGI